MAGMTLPQCLVKQAQEYPHGIAMREKQQGIWQEWTWAQYLEEVRTLTGHRFTGRWWLYRLLGACQYRCIKTPSAASCST